MKYLFGPVQSRRLGRSLGIDLLPGKICNLNCIYCEVGRITSMDCTRKQYSPTAEILAEIDRFLADPAKVDTTDVFTLTASGEPTLHSDLGRIVTHLKSHTEKPVAILTNGALLYRSDVQNELMDIDIVIPSLDSARPESFRKINRPAACNESIEGIIEGLRSFSTQYQGKFWLEILLAEGVNNSAADIQALRKAAGLIQPDKIQLNTVVRPPAEKTARPLTPAELRNTAQLFDCPVEIIVSLTQDRFEKFHAFDQNEVLNMLRRRPCTLEEICKALSLDPADAENEIIKLEKENLIHRTTHNDRRYYQTKKPETV